MAYNFELIPNVSIGKCAVDYPAAKLMAKSSGTGTGMGYYLCINPFGAELLRDVPYVKVLYDPRRRTVALAPARAPGEHTFKVGLIDKDRRNLRVAATGLVRRYNLEPTDWSPMERNGGKVLIHLRERVGEEEEDNSLQ